MPLCPRNIQAASRGRPRRRPVRLCTATPVRLSGLFSQRSQPRGHRLMLRLSPHSQWPAFQSTRPPRCVPRSRNPPIDTGSRSLLPSADSPHGNGCRRPDQLLVLALLALAARALPPPLPSPPSQHTEAAAVTSPPTVRERPHMRLSCACRWKRRALARRQRGGSAPWRRLNHGGATLGMPMRGRPRGAIMWRPGALQQLGAEPVAASAFTLTAPATSKALTVRRACSMGVGLRAAPLLHPRHRRRPQRVHRRRPTRHCWSLHPPRCPPCRNPTRPSTSPPSLSSSRSCCKPSVNVRQHWLRRSPPNCSAVSSAPLQRQPQRRRRRRVWQQSPKSGRLGLRRR
mmetsp:Transcript_2270/g.6433  ORF Transcript_2270/g.6433 Transcript_2270/m.6433 type:complete len:343 (+) Transcript_2270:332-1360(+)